MDSLSDIYELYMERPLKSSSRVEATEQWFNKNSEIRQWLIETCRGEAGIEGSFGVDQQSLYSSVEISSFHSVNGMCSSLLVCV